MSLATLLVELKFLPYFSVSYGEAYQYRPSYILPPPSTLLGALGRTLTIHKNIGYPENLKILREFIIDITATPLSYAAKTSMLLTRVRIEKEKGMRKDAMVREYISLPRLLCLFLLDMNKLPKMLDKENLVKISNSIDRIGDTESLCSVTLSKITSNIEVLNEKIVKGVNTYIKGDFLKDAKGDFTIVKMPSLEDPGKPINVYLPMIANNEKPSLYIPTTFQVTLNEKSQAILIENEYVMVTSKIK